MTPTLLNVIIDPYPLNIFFITFARISPFVLGIVLGYAISMQKKIPVAYLFISLLIGVALMVVNTLVGQNDNPDVGIWFHKTRLIPHMFTIVPVCAGLSYLFSLIKNYKYPILTFMGHYTFCIYILHERAVTLLYMLLGNTLLKNVLAFLIVLPLAYLWQNAVTYMLKKLNWK